VASNGIMVDGTNDTAGATGGLDLVGIGSAPAGLHAADAQFLYLRMRLQASPFTTRLQANAWGYEFDINGDRSNYEVIVSATGTTASDEVHIYRHTTTVTADDPADPAQTPAVFIYPFSTNGQVVAAGSTVGGGADAFLDLAVPWSDLANVGINRNTTVRIWAGSSTIPNALNLDLACFNGSGGTLSGIDVGPTTPDPNAVGPDMGAGGGGGTGGGDRTLEGGLGCGCTIGGAHTSEGSAVTAGALALLLGALAIAAPRLLLRRRRAAAGRR
jgi:hypothetical protein